MDLERIKQNLRLRSGRPRKAKKARAQPLSSSQLQNGLPIGTVNALPKPTEKNEFLPEHNGTLNAKQHQTEAEPHAADPNGADPRSAKVAGTAEGPAAEEPEAEQQNNENPRAEEDQPSVDQDKMKEPNQSYDMSDDADFDLRPPIPKAKPPSLETSSELLFSSGHLNFLLQEAPSVAKFTSFLSRYKPEYQPLVLKYLETQKAIKAVEYANAVAESAASDKQAGGHVPRAAATLDEAFRDASTSSFNSLVGTALPMYITYNLVKLVSECLTNEITGKQTPFMRNLVGGLSEVFCLTDPNQEDNPIVYASEEFYRLTGYGRDDVIGHNCRFLQGRKTMRESPKRLRDATENGQEHCETLLNYRRDGRPFMNLLMIAPLHDNKGKVKYNIGAQVDVTGLVEGGRGLDGFDRYLQVKQNGRGRQLGPRSADSKQRDKALIKLQELSEMFDLEESAIVQSHSRASSTTRDDDARSIESNDRRQRRIFVDSEGEEQENEEDEDKDDAETWKLGHSGGSGPSGKLPGIYDSYMLIRAAPSLRIIFVSPKLRKLGNIVQSPFLAHLAAPSTTLAGLKESFNTGTPVSAKVNFMAKAGERRNGTETAAGTKLEDAKSGRICWISATPLLGSDDRVGVWMVVMVEKSKVRQSRRTTEMETRLQARTQDQRPERIAIPERQTRSMQQRQDPQVQPDDVPIKPKRLEDAIAEAQEDKELELTVPGQYTTRPGGQENMPNSEAEAAADGDDFVIAKDGPSTPQNKSRIHIEPDSEDDQGSPDWQPAREQSNSVSHEPVPIPTEEIVRQTEEDPEDQVEMEAKTESEPPRKYTPPPEIPESMKNATPPPKTPDVHADEATPTRMRFSDGGEQDRDDEEDTGSPSTDRPLTHSRSNILTMDYLRHPGSGHVRENSQEHDEWSDKDCLRSPYSVD